MDITERSTMPNGKAHHGPVELNVDLSHGKNGIVKGLTYDLVTDICWLLGIYFHMYV